jgi:glycosyltransferase involved in cell wall biosynthesis
MLDRLAEEKKLRTVALAYPKDGIWWLEIWADSRNGIFPLGGRGNGADMIERAASLVGTSAVHIENLSGLSLNLVADLDVRGISTVISIHDFTLFCRNPHLIEKATGNFCDYCQDEDRCNDCLKGVEPDRQGTQADYRRDGAIALARATAVIYPSQFLKRQHRILFPDLRGPKQNSVIEPSTLRPVFFERTSSRHPRIAFVGGVYSHKGGALLAPTMKHVRNSFPQAMAFVYGNGEGPLMRQLRGIQGIRVRGYYGHGKLPSLLERDKVSVAVLPSIWPEAYALVVDECLSVGVPVIAFDHGAVADRLKSWQAGEIVQQHLGAEGLADSIVKIFSADSRVPAHVIASLPQPKSSAQKHMVLYQGLNCAAEGV